MKLIITLYLALVLTGVLFGCSTAANHVSSNAPNQLPQLPLRYYNTQSDLAFFLPASWLGYSVMDQQWEGTTYSAAEDKTVVVGHGPMIILRHPQWKASAPYQDIPILVFTRRQWDALNHGKLWPTCYVGGTMDEICHNSQYVFAISSRFNAADGVNGWKEAGNAVNQNIMANVASDLYPH